MDPSDNSGVALTRFERIFQLDLFGRSLADQLDLLADTEPETFARLAKEISGGNLAVENEILRCWRIRR